jgi:hypothetical protein
MVDWGGEERGWRGKRINSIDTASEHALSTPRREARRGMNERLNDVKREDAARDCALWRRRSVSQSAAITVMQQD